MEIQSPKVKHVAIEELLFDEFHVAKYDERDNLTLDKKYYCAGHVSALFCAIEIAKEGSEKLPIYLYTANQVNELTREDIDEVLGGMALLVIRSKVNKHDETRTGSDDVRATIPRGDSE